MPYKTENDRITSKFLKRSSKLLDCQKEMVVYWSNRGMSQRKLAAMFHVSRRLIQFIIDPDKHKANLERRRERGGYKYPKEQHNSYMKSHRDYKNELFNPDIKHKTK